jgi:CBS domain-containing protein
MKAEDVMTRDVKSCFVDETAAEAAHVMWENDCGAVPVIDRENRLMGMVTDRDLCMAAYTQGRLLRDIALSTAASRTLVSARRHDEVSVVETLMERHQLRRIPIVDGDRRLIGVVTMNDLVRHARADEPSLGPADVVRTLAAIGERRPAHAVPAE